jgi:hypothetical protein
VPVGGGGGHKEKVKVGKIWWKHFVFMYENRIMKPFEIAPRRGRGNKGERWRK